MKQLLIILFLFSLSSTTFANSTVCHLVETTGYGIKAISWDSSTLEAKIIDEKDKTHKGKVTLSREHKPYGIKTNIFIQYKKPYFGADAEEYIIFPVGIEKFRIIGVTYHWSKNKYHFNSLRGNRSAKCLSI